MFYQHVSTQTDNCCEWTNQFSHAVHFIKTFRDTHTFTYVNKQQIIVEGNGKRNIYKEGEGGDLQALNPC